MARILVIEDELEKPIEDNLFIEVLLSDGHIIDYAETGDDAIDHLTNAHYDIIILDIMVLPTTNDIPRHIELREIPRPDIGVTILEMIRRGHLRENGVDPDIPIVVISAVTGDKRWNRIKKLVPNDCIIRKPCPPHDIIDKVNSCLY